MTQTTIASRKLSLWTGILCTLALLIGTATAASAGTAYLNCDPAVGGGTACTRSAPRQTLNQAITTAGAGGTVYTLNDYACAPATNITQTVTILGRHLLTIGIASGNAITVNIGTNDHVTLSKVRLLGADDGAGVGVYINSGGTLNINNCSLLNLGTSICQGASSTLHITNSHIEPTCHTSATCGGYGLYSQAGTAVLSRVTVHGNNGAFRVIARGTTTHVDLTDHCNLSSDGNGVAAYADMGAQMQIQDASIHNKTVGVESYGASPPNTRIDVFCSHFRKNGTAVLSVAGGQLCSFGNNTFADNAANGSFNCTGVTM